MPIYAYKCSSCGHTLDALQKVSDAPLSSCPQCGAETLSKQLTAAGFQLRGSGWYATDFKNGSAGRNGAAAAKAGESKSGESKSGESKSGESKSGESEGAAKTEKSADAAASGSCGHGGCSACS